MTADNITDSQFADSHDSHDSRAPRDVRDVRDSEAADALLTAHALGQLSGDERADVERLSTICAGG